MISNHVGSSSKVMIYLLASTVAALVLNPRSLKASETATVLFEIDRDVTLAGGSSGLSGPFNDVPINIRVTTPAPYVTLSRIFNGLSVTRADIGRIFVADASNDSGFAGFAQRLTDGVENWVSLPGVASSTFGSECNHFHGDTSCGSGIGLEGFAIERATYTIKDWYNVTPGRDPNHNGIWTDAYFGFRFTIEGHAIPEPDALMLIIIGVFSIPAIRRR